jgi:hypothetical protein
MRPKITIVFDAGFVAIVGETYPVKETIKALGFRWDAAGKRWVTSNVRKVDLARIVKRLADVSDVVVNVVRDKEPEIAYTEELLRW